MMRWIRYAAMAFAAIILITFAVRANLSTAALRENPPLAARLNPENGFAQDRLVELEIAAALEKQDAGALDQIEPQARTALSHEPFALSSLALLSMTSRAAGEEGRADLLLDHASSLSRRDMLVQLQLIQRAAQREDLNAMIAHVDATLRSRQSGYPLIFPQLAQYLNRPEMIGPLSRVARQDPAWYKLFIGEALTVPAALPAIRTLLMRVPEGSAARDPQVRRNLISQLIATDRVPAARSYFRSLHPQAGEGLLFDPDFTHPEYEAPFGWSVSEDPDLTADFVQGEGLLAYAGSSREGIVARQLVSLSPGRYTVRLDGERADLGVTYVEVDCRKGAELLGASPSPSGVYNFTVPARCPFQTIGIGIRDDDDSAPAEAAIRSIALVPGNS